MHRFMECSTLFRNAAISTFALGLGSIALSGHVARTGTHADVEVQAEFNRDVKQAAATALATTKPGEGLNPLDKANPWAGFDNYIDRVAAQCVNTLGPKWSNRLAGFDVYIWDQCYAMEQSLRIE